MPQAFNESRPSADALLHEAQRDSRGRLKIFLGAAPGVGKTYEMLASARRKIAEGADVVVGILETHGRVETQALLEGMPQISRRALEYRGRRMQELDIDALLARKPRIALIDELAHTNVPGSRHAKRYQDVQELLAAGIDVYTTLNVQHLESYKDIVARITGVAIQETVPDAIVEQATDVELIDLSPDDLIERLRQGKVYVPEQALRALDNYFSRGNLLALRELALRAAAEHVDDDLATYMRAHAIEGPWPARGRLLVCLDATDAGEDLVRAAKRLADQRHLPWTAIYVQTLGSNASAAAREQLNANLALASQLGGDTAILPADRIGEAIVDYARTHNAAQIVVGRLSKAARWRRRHHLAEWLIAHAIDFEITVAAAKEVPKHQALRRRERQRWRRGLTQRDALLAVVTSLGAVIVCWFIEPWVDASNLSLVFLLAVTVAGGFGGLGAALLASVLGFLLHNFLFIAPRYSLQVNQPQDLAALIVFLGVSLIVGQLAGRLRRQAQDAWRGTQRVETLFDFSRRLATVVDEHDLVTAGSRGVGDVINRECLVLRAQSESRVETPLEKLRDNSYGDVDAAAADWAFVHREPAGFGTGTLPAARWYCLPVIARGQSLGVIALYFPLSTDEIAAEERRLLFALQAQLSAAWERLRLRQTVHDASVQRAAESLRSALLASVSHDLRTPLVAVIGSLTALRELDDELPPVDREQLLNAAIKSADRLNRLIQNLLDMTRLSHGKLSMQMTAVDVRDVVSEALTNSASVLEGHRVEVRLNADLPAVRADRTLLGIVLVNLLENAAKYAPVGTEILVVASEDSAVVKIAVEDHGPGIQASDRKRVFDFFQRAAMRDSVIPGSGLGLPICKGFVEAMGGSIAARAGDNERGTRIEVALPRSKPPKETRSPAEGVSPEELPVESRQHLSQ